MPQGDEDRIRRRAYELWEREGRPEGRQSAHWEQAREDVARQGDGAALPRNGRADEPDSAKGGGAILPAAKPGDSVRPRAKAESGKPAPRRKGPAGG